jgi:hypothetical protein
MLSNFTHVLTETSLSPSVIACRAKVYTSYKLRSQGEL